MVSINYPLLVLAICLLWMPRHWMRAGRRIARALGLARRSRTGAPSRIREPGDTRVNFTEEFRKPRNYVDFLRALTGGLILMGNTDWSVSSCFVVPDALTDGGGHDLLLFQVRLALVTIGLFLQFIRMERRITFYAPLFYIGGLAVAMCGFGTGLFAFLLIWTFNRAVPIAPVGFLFVYDLMLFLLGLLFQGLGNWNVLAATGLFLLPVIVSLLAGRSLALFNKKIK